MAVLLVVYKLLLAWLAHGNSHNRIVWFGVLAGTGADIIYACVAFASCGYFQRILEELPSINSDDPELGLGWGLELTSAFIAMICGVLGVLVLVKGIGENEANGGKNAI